MVLAVPIEGKPWHYRKVTVHFNHALTARVFGSDWRVTPNAENIYCGNAWISRKKLAHEIGHTEDALRLGWKYLPTIARDFVKYGHENSPSEIRANTYRDAHWQEWPHMGQVPEWAKGEDF